ncbi:hypothetical protein [Absidia glauca]|uniref:Amidohydrolase-related domain-containing protein n=1 Tax=Absidia glauca TaxID=4829 RepID=A0A163K2V1_ABSGL|nr:hypothetical protein [Absidia glauca]
MTRPITQIIDTHIHFWQPGQVHIPWVKGTQFDDDKDARHYSAAVAGVGVRQGVYVETDVDVRHGLVEAAWIHDYSKRLTSSEWFGGLGAVVAFAPVDQGATAMRPYLRLLRHLVGPDLLRGVRFLLQGIEAPYQRMLSPDLVSGLRVLGEDEFGLLFELVIDCHRQPAQFDTLLALVRQCPSVSFVLDHMGKPPCASRPGSEPFEHWATCMKALAGCSNVVACKVSGLLTELDGDASMISAQQLGPFVQVAKESFGVDRLVFGGDWPVCEAQGASWQQWVDVLVEIVHDWDPQDQTQLFVTNAQRLYKLN